jgi:hypothetical protein
MFLQDRKRGTRTLDQSNVVRPARSRFEAQNSAAGEQIETGLAAQILSQPVEQGFSDPVRSWPQAGPVGHVDQAAAPFAAGDADPAQDLIGRDDHGHQVLRFHMADKGGFHLLYRYGVYLGRKIVEIGQRQTIETDGGQIA